MKLKIFYSNNGLHSATSEDNALLSSAKNQEIMYKFVYEVVVNIETEEVYVAMSIASKGEHLNLLTSLLTLIKKSKDLHLVQSKNRLGGGSLVINKSNTKLIFCDGSTKFGPYDPINLQKVEAELKKFFVVDQIVYFTSTSDQSINYGVDFASHEDILKLINT